MTPQPKKKADDKKKASAAKKPAAKTAPKKAAPKAAKTVKVEKKTAATSSASSSAQPSPRLRPASKATADRPAPKAAASTQAPAVPTKLKGIRIRLSAFDHTVIDEAALKIIDTAVRTGAVVHGPIPLPTKIRKFTVNRSTFVHKDARDQFEMRIHRRLIDLSETTFKTVDSLQNLSLPSGVDIEIRMG